MEGEPREAADAVIETLARLFANHPAWRAAARRLAGSAESNVYFGHRPGEAWHLEHHGGEIRLLPGRSASPDFAFRFAPGAVEALASVEGGIGEFAVALFELFDTHDADRRVDLRVVASFPRLFRRGYVRLLLEAGPAVIGYGARRGIRSIRTLERLVDATRSKEPLDWEVSGDS